MTRAEHLAWTKQRAIDAYDYSGKSADAISSLASDFGKHPETAGHVQLTVMLGMATPMTTRQQVVNFINGFN